MGAWALGCSDLTCSGEIKKGLLAPTPTARHRFCVRNMNAENHGESVITSQGALIGKLPCKVQAPAQGMWSQGLWLAGTSLTPLLDFVQEWHKGANGREGKNKRCPCFLILVLVLDNLTWTKYSQS